MLTEREKKFMEYWAANRQKEQQLTRQLLTGLPIGLLAVIPVFIVLFSGRFWYKRADAVANAQLNPVVLLVALFILAVFISVFYRRYRWEQQEQLYKELKIKVSKSEKIVTDAANATELGS